MIARFFLQMRSAGRHFAPFAILVATVAPLPAQQQADTLYVSLQGRDTWSGRLSEPNASRTDGPLGSLEKARDRVRNNLQSGAGARVVRVEDGLWLRNKPFVLDSSDGGSLKQPVVWEFSSGAHVSGAIRLAGWTRVRDAAIIARLDKTARDSVMVARIPDGVDIERWRSVGRSIRPAPPELVWNGQVLQVAQWPDTGWDRIASVDSTHGVRIRVLTDRIARWASASDAWVYGYWRYDWHDAFIRVTSVDAQSGELLLAGKPDLYGIAPGQRYRIINLIEELSARGEYWIDVEHRLVYVWPPSDPGRAESFLSVLTDPVLEVRGASDLTIRGLRAEASRGEGILIEGGARVQVLGGSLRSLGGRAIEIRGGAHHVVRDVVIQDVGEGGIRVSGGDRRTLTASGHLIEHVQFRNFARWVRTYTPAVYLTGVGATVRLCEISDAPHSGIILEGNDHVIENNTLHHLLLETRDAGAIYLGRDWTARGNVIRENYFFALGPDRPVSTPAMLQAVYLDDMASGVMVERNVFDHAQIAVKIGGGRDNRIENNVIVHSVSPLSIDERGVAWLRAADQPGSMWQHLVGLYEGARPDLPPYLERYPTLRSALTDRPGAPVGNVFMNNVVVGGGPITRVVPPGMLDERGTVRIVDKDEGLWGPARMQSFLDSLAKAGVRAPQRLPPLTK
jgi:Right handed beta helix region